MHLTISSIVVLIVALTYGVNPATVLSKLFDFNVDSTDLRHVFRATMGLYSGMMLLWVIGIFKPAFWKTATISNIFFMGGLAFGRLISVAFDGFASMYFSIGIIVELILALWGIINLNQYRRDEID